jgi:hypothetical protein
MSLPTPSKLHGSLRINMPRIEDKKIQRLLVVLAKKIAQGGKPDPASKQVA